MDRVLTSSEEVSCGGRLADVNVGSDGMGRVLLLNVRKHRYMLPADLIAIPRIFNPDICLKLKSFFLYTYNFNHMRIKTRVLLICTTKDSQHLLIYFTYIF